MTDLFAYLFYFVAATASPLQRRALAVKKSISWKEQVSFAFHVQLWVTILGTLLLPLFSPILFADIGTLRLILLLVVCGVCGALTITLNYIAQRHVDAAVTSIVSNIYTPVTIILATLFLGESLTNIQILGTALLLCALMIISKKHRTGRFTFDTYFLMMLASGVILAGVLIAERALQKELGLTTGTLLSWWAVTVCMGIAAILIKSKHTYTKKDVAITSVFRILQQLSWVTLVFVVGNLSVVSSIATFKVVLIFIAGALFLKEREDIPRKIVGSILAVVGLLLMK